MCGILGIMGRIDTDLARRCLATIRHRGPDGEGLWQDNGVTLGHRRLAILDTSEAGRQPMSYANQRYWITFNGEIYNFIEIRAELEGKGHRFGTGTDTEVLLAAFVEWGESCLPKLNGMWAFAIWDVHQQRLFLSRDRLGKKPLFYAETQFGFAFASEMKALFPLLGTIDANSDLIRDRARLFTYETTSECVIRGISRFPAGSYGWFEKGRLRLSRWWCTLDHLPRVPSRYEEQVDCLRELLIDSCRIRMRSDVPIGTALSGGLDSSAVMATMKEVAKRGGAQRGGRDWQHAFVASFPGTPLDESHYAKEVADHLGVPATFIKIDPVEAMGRLEEFFYLFEDLYITSPIPFMLTYGAVKKAGISVTLDGHGADELFGGYSFDYLFALRDAGASVGQALGIIRTFYDAWPKETQQFPALPHPLLYWGRWHLAYLKSKLIGRPTENSSSDAAHEKWGQLDHLSRQLYRSTHETVLPTLLRNYDRYSMANGVEIRMPFLDHRILTFAFALPWHAKLRGGYSKAVIRDAVKPFLPPGIVWRKSKLGFNAPVVDWFKGPLRPIFLDMIADKAFRQCDLIDPVAASGAVHHVIESPHASFQDGERAWTLLMPYLWERAVVKRSVLTA